jgi:hypothetical protein
MGTVLASAIIDKVEILLKDTSNARWAASELLGWLNDAQRAIAILKPDTSVTNASVQLVQGTKQSVPTGGIALIAIRRNMGADGSTVGDAIRVIDMDVLDAAKPDWHSATYENVVVKNYMFDERDPTKFYVYPAQTSSPTYVEMVYATNPTEIASVSTAISLDDIYETVLMDYVLFKAYSKDGDIEQAANLAAMHYNAFQNALISKDRKEAVEQASTKETMTYGN